MAKKSQSSSQIQPFSDEHYQLMCSLAGSCAQTAELLDRYERAGLPVAGEKSENEQQLKIALGLKQQFFPGRP